MSKVTMEDAKLTISREKDRSSEGVKPIFVHASYHAKLRELKKETNVPLGELLEIFIDFAMPRLEIKGDD